MPEPEDYCDRCMSTGYLLTSECPDCKGTGSKTGVPLAPDFEALRRHSWGKSPHGGVEVDYDRP